LPPLRTVNKKYLIGSSKIGKPLKINYPIRLQGVDREPDDAAAIEPR
jgi:hypothetical protein